MNSTSQEDEQVASLKKKHPERTIFCAELTQGLNWKNGEEMFDAQIVPNTRRLLFAVDEKYTDPCLYAFLMDPGYKTVRL